MAGSPERVRQVFAEAMQRPPEQRGAFIERACAGEATLLAEVKALVQAMDEAAAVGFFASPTHGQSSSSLPALVAAPRASGPTEGPGTIIGPYKLLQLIGEGGFGSVFMAQQDKPVQRKVALKIIKLGMDTRQVIARFEAERQALAVMDHPHIAKVLDAGATDTGRPYFVMELVNGIPITEYCDREILSTHDRLGLFIETCNAVQHAHQKGIIHRDIKPSNVLVTIFDGKPVPKVIDFGIAKATTGGGNLAKQTQFTQVGQFIGTPEYMSPEQAAMTDLDIDTRTDVYSLGVLLYELLTGTTPFESTMLRRAGVAAIQRIIQEEDPPKPSTRVRLMATTQVRPSSPTPRDAQTVVMEANPGSATDFSRTDSSLETIARQRQTDPKSLCRALRGDLDWIIMKALEKDRARRYESVTGLAADIKRHLSHEPVTAGAPGTVYRMRKFVRRNRVVVLAGSLIAAALVLGIIGTTNQSIRATRAADKAERAAYEAQIVSAAHAIEDQRMDAGGALLAATPPRLRGWEYRHLESRLDRSLPSPFPADWRVSSLNVAAASGTIAVQKLDDRGSSYWAILNPDLQTERFALPETEDGDLALSPDGTRAIWIPVRFDDQRSAVFWNIDAKTVLATFPIQSVQWFKSQETIVTWSPAGDRFAASSPDGFEVYDGHTGVSLHRQEMNGTALFTGDSRWMFVNNTRFHSGAGQRECHLLDAQTFKPQPKIFQIDSSILTRFTSFWRSRVACAVEDGTLRVLEIVDGALQERSRLAGGIGVLTFPGWSPDGRLIAVGSFQGRVRIWDAESENLRGDFAGEQSPNRACLFLPESGNLLACDVAGHHRVWPTSGGSPGVLTAHKSFVYPVVLSKDGGMLLTGGWDGASGHSGGLKLWDARTGALVAEYGRIDETFQTADLTPDGRYAVAGIVLDVGSVGRIEVIDLTSGAVVANCKATPARFQPMCTIVHPDGHRVISTFPPGEAYVWELLTGKILWKTDLHGLVDSVKRPSCAAAVSRDGRVLALSDNQLGIRLVNAETYADIRRWDAHQESVWSLSFTPDGKWLLSASTDDTIGVWDVATGALGSV